jgi:integrative and conjugative element protein (TIGR02256 family)
MLTPLSSGDVKHVQGSALQNPKARELADVLAKPGLPFTRLIRCERVAASKLEAVVLEVEVEVGQKTVHDIRRLEPIGIVFDPDDLCVPEVLALREDFPINVPHQNMRPSSGPRSLCLYEEPYSEIKLHWSTTGFVERIREWLRLTARGELHQEDQQLEALLISSDETIILPHDLLETGDQGKLSRISVGILNDSDRSPVYRIIRGDVTDPKPPHAIASVFRPPPFTHGIIRSQPTNLLELHVFVNTAGYDLCAELKTRLRDWIVSNTGSGISSARLFLVMILPKKRTVNSPVETNEIWTFATIASVEQISIALGVKDQKGGFSAIVINDSGKPPDLSKVQNIGVTTLRTVQTLYPARAAIFNGFSEPYSKKVVGIGMGALGSQIFNNLLRTGFGDWTLVDKDILLPHNCARHILPGFAVGHSKAASLALLANATVEGKSPVKAITTDVLAPEDQRNALNATMSMAELILDFSASVAVARHLANIKSSARRISIFLNPTGSDVVILTEDTHRKASLVQLEMEYYRLLATEKTLTGHLADAGEKVRYSRSCGDLSSRMNQSLVAMHAAIASGCLRKLVEDDRASITIFRSDSDFTVRRLDFGPPKFVVQQNADWLVSVSSSVFTKVHQRRKERLPTETGGVLIGSFDRLNKIVYIVDALGSPKDSTEWPSLYIRGVRGLRTALDEIGKATMSNLEYVGEWHSHPRGCPAEPSPTDKRALASLAKLMRLDSLPAVMLIVADRNRHRFFLGK